MTGQILIHDVGDPVVVVEPPFGDLGDVLIEALHTFDLLPIAQKVCKQHPQGCCIPTTVAGVTVHVDEVLATMMLHELEACGETLGDHGKPVLAYLRGYR